MIPLLLCALAPSLSLASVDTDGDGLTDEYEQGYGRYQFITGNFSWSQAKADAEARGGHLGTITSAQEHEFLRANFSGYANGSLRPWLGGTDAAQEGVWRWVTGEVWNYTRWMPSQPDDQSRAQHYLWSGHVEPASQLWDDFGLGPEAAINCYLLEFGYPTDPLKADTDGDGFNDKIESDFGSDPNNPTSTPPVDAVTIAAGTATEAFVVIEGAFTWHQARADALGRGGRLAVFPTGDKYDRVISEVRQKYSGNLWLGLTDEVQEGVWRWIDGTSLTYSRWHGGEPNNTAGAEDYAHVIEGNGKTWNDNAASASLPYLFERQVKALAALLVSEGGQAWTVDTTQTHDGVSSAKAQTTDGQSTYRDYMVTGPAVVDFWWKVSSEKNFDTFSYSLNGVNQETISGEVDWTYRTLTLPAGTHTIRWTYSKDDSGAIGQDAGWLDEFAVYPATATLRVRDGATLLDSRHTVDFGSTALQGNSPTKSLTFSNEGYVPLEVQLSLPAGSPFTFESGMLSYELLLARGESVDVPISLATDSAGTKTALLTIEATDSDVAPPIIALQGILLGQKISVGRGGNALTLGQSINMGLAPRTLHFTISNTGNVGDLIISQISSTGNFQITQQPQATIAPQSSTSFTVLAQAVAFGSQTGGITITSNDPDTPAFTIPLSATAFAVGGDGIRSDSMATSGSGGAVGWGFASTQLPGGATGQALKTGSTPNNGGSVLEFTSQTAGVVTWSWKVSTQEEFDWLLCEVDGQETAGISTKNGFWQTQVVNVPAGANVRWVYRKDGSGSIGEDAGYLADVEFRSFAANQSFNQWAQTHGISDPQQRLPKSGLKAMFAWLGGIDPAVGTSALHRDIQLMPDGNFLSLLLYRFSFSKTADGTQQILFSPDMSSWTTRRISQRVVSEDADRVVIEATAPSGTKGFLSVVGAPNPLELVEPGVLPDSSELAGTSVATFRIGRTEVTWAEWQEVRAWAANNGYDLAGVGQGSGPDYPVRKVSWYDSLKWCNAKSEKEGLTPVYWVAGAVYRTGQTTPSISGNADGYRLPTEAEWEWAARGGDNGKQYVYSGSNDLDAVGWFHLNSSGAVANEGAQWGSYGEGRGTWPVAQKLANELGIYDMSGNIVEWCWYASSNPSSSVAVRGGSFLDVAELCRLSHRSFASPWALESTIGFRVARNAEN